MCVDNYISQSGRVTKLGGECHAVINVCIEVNLVALCISQSYVEGGVGVSCSDHACSYS